MSWLSGRWATGVYGLHIIEVIFYGFLLLYLVDLLFFSYLKEYFHVTVCLD